MRDITPEDVYRWRQQHANPALVWGVRMTLGLAVLCFVGAFVVWELALCGFLSGLMGAYIAWLHAQELHAPVSEDERSRIVAALKHQGSV